MDKYGSYIPHNTDIDLFKTKVFSAKNSQTFHRNNNNNNNKSKVLVIGIVYHNVNGSI